MILKFEAQVNVEEMRNYNVDFLKVTKNQFEKELAHEIMKFVNLEEREEKGTPYRRLLAEVHVLPPSQYEHVMSLLKNLKGISPQIDSVVRQIAAEL